MKTLCFLFLAMISAHSWGQTIEIKSNPEEAEIFIISDSSVAPSKVGKTPFKTSLKDLVNEYVKKNTFIIEIRKEGFEPYRVLFPKATSVDIELSVNMDVNEDIKKIKKHDLLMNELFDVQKLIRGKNFPDALAKLDTLEKDYKDFSVIAELKGTAYYMMEDVEKALSFYRRAFALNSDNIDAYKMKVYLEKKLGIDTETK